MTEIPLLLGTNWSSSCSVLSQWVFLQQGWHKVHSTSLIPHFTKTIFRIRTAAFSSTATCCRTINYRTAELLRADFNFLSAISKQLTLVATGLSSKMCLNAYLSQIDSCTRSRFPPNLMSLFLNKVLLPSLCFCSVGEVTSGGVGPLYMLKLESC